MNEALYRISLGSFLILPALLLCMRFLRPSRMPWWVVLLLLGGGGWLLVNATVYFYYEHLAEVVRLQPNPPVELLDRLNADGAKRVFALLFGWLYGPFYSVPFLFAFGLASWLRRRGSTVPGHAA